MAYFHWKATEFMFLREAGMLRIFGPKKTYLVIQTEELASLGWGRRH